MKKSMFLMICLIACCQNISAGDKEWGTVGKILTGAVVADIFLNHQRHSCCCDYHRDHPWDNSYQHNVIYLQPSVVVSEQPPTTIIVRDQPTYVVETQQVFVPTGTVREVRIIPSYFDQCSVWHPAQQLVEYRQIGYYKTVQVVKEVRP